MSKKTSIKSKLLTTLEKKNSFSVAQARSRTGGHNITARIDELRQDGHPITTDWRVNSTTGRKVAVYKLASTKRRA